MEPKDVEACQPLLETYLKKYVVASSGAHARISSHRRQGQSRRLTRAPPPPHPPLHPRPRFTFAPVISEEDFRHWMLPREGVVYSFVVEDPETKKVTDMVSFYSLPSTVVQAEVPTVLQVRRRTGQGKRGGAAATRSAG